MNRENLEELLNEGKSTYEIAAIFGYKSNSSVRAMMKKYGLKSKAKAGSKSSNPIIDGKYKKCNKCNMSRSLDDYAPRKDRPGSYYGTCKPCWVDAASKKYVMTKSALVAHKGGKCQCCDKTYNIESYSFHHIEPEHKDFTISRDMANVSYYTLLKELDKCILVCQNCHAEIHHEMNKDAPLSPKNAKNTERWNKQREYKLNYVNFEEPKCSECGYGTYLGALNIIFPEGKNHYKKYNKNFENWDDDFKLALNESRILCSNCARVDTLSETTQSNLEELNS